MIYYGIAMQDSVFQELTMSDWGDSNSFVKDGEGYPIPTFRCRYQTTSGCLEKVIVLRAEEKAGKPTSHVSVLGNTAK